MRDRFRLLVHESTGQKYEDLFIKIMGYADTSFKPVKAHGNIGDRGNDGYSAIEGKYFQVYAPENLPRNNNSDVKKLQTDFKKLFSYWNSMYPVQEYIFVVNDKYQGVSPHIYKAIFDLKNTYNLLEARIFLAKDLEDLLFCQNQDVINSVLGSYPEDDQKSFYKYLAYELLRKLHLEHWQYTSNRLDSNSIPTLVTDGIEEFSMIIVKTVMPNTIPSLESSLGDLVCRANLLRKHFTKSDFTYLNDKSNCWERDMRWKRYWINSQDEYREKYNLYVDWSKRLHILHWNFVHSLNVFSTEVRRHVDANYFNRSLFTIESFSIERDDIMLHEGIPIGYKDDQ